MEAYIVYPTKEQEKVIIDFFRSLNIPYQKKEEVFLPAFVLDGIKGGQKDIKSGRTVSLEEFKKILSASE